MLLESDPVTDAGGPGTCVSRAGGTLTVVEIVNVPSASVFVSRIRRIT